MNAINLVLFLMLSVHLSSSANILAVTTLASPSHHLWHKVLLLGLIENGHNVTVLGHDTETRKISNFTMITLEGVYNKIHKDFILEDLIHNGPLKSLKLLWEWDELLCQYDLETEGLRTILNYPEDYKFDLIIWDLNCGRCLYPLIDRFGTPQVIATSPFGLQSFIEYIFGNHIFSYIPYYQVHLTDKMDFLVRLQNFVYRHVMNLSRRYYLLPREYNLAKEFFGDDIRPFDEVERRFSLLLVNNDPIVHFAEPLPPNIIPVAGIHIKPVEQLLKDIKTILDTATHGVVLVVFGTNLNWRNFKEQQRNAFLEAFQKLPQIILIKSPKENLDVPSNIVAREWLPQNDILAHPNVKLFVTHGGALSTQEAMFHGVPVVGVPFFLDQHGNMARIEERELGKTIDFLRATPDIVHDTLKEVLYNPKYQNNMKTLSRRFRDQPQTPLERAIFWIEYVLRHGTGEHFSPATRDMNIFQRFDLDIAVVLLSVLICLFFAFFKIAKYLGNVLRRRNVETVEKLKQN